MTSPFERSSFQSESPAPKKKIDLKNRLASTGGSLEITPSGLGNAGVVPRSYVPAGEGKKIKIDLRARLKNEALGLSVNESEFFTSGDKMNRPSGLKIPPSNKDSVDTKGLDLNPGEERFFNSEK